MGMFRLLPTILSIAAVVLIVSLINTLYPLRIQTSNTTTEFSVVGEGKVDVTPDTAYVDAGIAVNNVKTVEESQKSMDEINNKVIEAMKKIGVKKEDITTSNYSIYPNYSYDDKSSSTITGYNGNVTVSIKVKEIDMTSRVIEEATKAGANQITGTRFVVDNPDTYREQAREEAIKNAKTQAEKLSKSLGIHLGKITNMYEQTNGTPVFSDVAMRQAAIGYAGGGGGGPQIEPGTQTVTSVVTLYFQKK